jgi:hypothetical protein
VKDKTGENYLRIGSFDTDFKFRQVGGWVDCGGRITDAHVKKLWKMLPGK